MSDQPKKALVVLATLLVVSLTVGGFVLSAMAQGVGDGCPPEPTPTDTNTTTAAPTIQSEEDGGLSCEVTCTEVGQCTATVVDDGVTFTLTATFDSSGGTIFLESEDPSAVDCGDQFNHAPRAIFFDVTGTSTNVKTFALKLDKSVAPPKGGPQFAVCFQADSPFTDRFGQEDSTGILPICANVSNVPPCQNKPVKGKNGTTTITGTLRNDDPHLK